MRANRMFTSICFDGTYRVESTAKAPQASRYTRFDFLHSVQLLNRNVSASLWVGRKGGVDVLHRICPETRVCALLVTQFEADADALGPKTREIKAIERGLSLDTG